MSSIWPAIAAALLSLTPRPEISRRGSLTLGVALLPHAAYADGAKSLASEQIARSRYGPRILQMREALGARRVDLRKTVGSAEESAIRLFISGAYPSGSEGQRALEQIERTFSQVRAPASVFRRDRTQRRSRDTAAPDHIALLLLLLRFPRGT